MKCFCCEKEMKEDPDGILQGGGTAQLSFGYGSRFDCCGFDFELPEKTDAPRVDRLAACPIIVGYICDDCFEKKQGFFEGWKMPNIRPKPNRVV